MGVVDGTTNEHTYFVFYSIDQEKIKKINKQINTNQEMNQKTIKNQSIN